MALPNPEHCEANRRARARIETQRRLAEESKVRAEQAWHDVTDERLAAVDQGERARLNAQQSEFRREIDDAQRLIETLDNRIDELANDARFNQC